MSGLIAESNLAGLAVFLDCCHSERFIEQMLVGKGLGNGFSARQYFLSMACRGYEYAYENKGEPYSAYTAALLSALQDEAAGKISVVKAHEAVKDRLKGQEAISLSYGSDFVVVDYRRAVPIEQTVSEECPYQGLQAFQPETARFFFGREKEKQLLWERLQKSNFVAVLGPSGSGKSSVVRAGLVTRLEAEGWRVLTMMPSDQPMANLKSVVGPLWEGLPGREQRRLRSVLQSEGVLAMAQQLAEVMPAVDSETQQVLLLVDQFEEVFTQCAEGKEKERDRFIEGLVAVGKAQTPLAVVMTMRSDFVNEWLATGQPPEVMNHDAVYLGPLKGENLQAAIVEPARLQGYSVEPGLLTLLLDDVAKEENCLPLLEFALQELWEERDTEKRVLTATAYVDIGRLKGALDKQAERVFCEKLLREVDRECARRVCLELVRIGRGGRDTRQRQPKEKLLKIEGEGEEKQQVVADVVAELLKGRLFVSSGDEADAYVDVAHEALLEGWNRFARWRQEGRELRQLLQRLTDAYVEWKEEKQESDEYLLSGGLLAELRERKEAINEALAEGRPELVRYFSLSDEQEQQKVVALEQALARADIQENSRKVRDKLLCAPSQTVDATIEAISLLGRSQEDFKQVIHPSQDAMQRSFSCVCERLRIGCRSKVLSVAFSPKGDCFVSAGEDSTLRLWDLEGNPIGAPFVGHGDFVQSVAFSPKGDRIVSGSKDNTLRLWDLQGNPIGAPFVGHSGSVWSVDFSPEGDCIVSGSDDSTLRLWDLDGNLVSPPLSGHTSAVYAVTFSPNGKYVASGGRDNAVRLWTVTGKSLGGPIGYHDYSVYALAFSPDGRYLASGGGDTRLQIWDLTGSGRGSTPDEPYRFESYSDHSGAVKSVSFSSKGSWLLSSSDDNTLRLWNLEDGYSVNIPFAHHSGEVKSASFSPEGDQIISGSSDKTIRLWNLESNFVHTPSSGHSGAVNSVSFSPQEDWIISGSDDNTLRLWDLEGNLIGDPFMEPLTRHRGAFYGASFNRKGDQIVSGSLDRTLRLWNLEGDPIGAPFSGHEDFIWTVAFNPKGNCVASGSRDKTLRLWDLEGNLIGAPFIGHNGSVRSVAFHPAGKYIVSGSDDNTLRLWNLEGNPIGEPFTGHRFRVTSVSFSREGNYIVSGSDGGTLRLWHGGTWKDWLRQCCNLLIHHTALTLPQDETARNACKVCEQVWTRQQSAQFAVAQGSALARQGEIEAAVEKFERAKGLDPTLEIDSVGRARELAEWASAPLSPRDKEIRDGG